MRCQFLWLQTKRAQVCWPSTVSRDPSRKIRHKDPQWVFRFARLKLPRLARQAHQHSPVTAVGVADEAVRFQVPLTNINGKTEPAAKSSSSSFSTRPIEDEEEDEIYTNSSSNSPSRRSNNRSVLSMGAGVVISTPAAFRVSSGNLE